jgi:hypothetical protein
VAKFDFRSPERFLPADAVDELLEAECQELLNQSLNQPELAAAITGLMDIDTATAATLDNATTDLLRCGCDRRTLLLVPRDQPESTAAQKLRAARPQASLVPTDVADVVVISEETGISPRSLALALERVFPGIADAARRLLTRIDIDWKQLA